jgi:hypothetical protein
LLFFAQLSVGDAFDQGRRSYKFSDQFSYELWAGRLTDNPIDLQRQERRLKERNCWPSLNSIPLGCFSSATAGSTPRKAYKAVGLEYGHSKAFIENELRR